MSFVKWVERTMEVMAYAWRLAADEDYCLMADFIAEPDQKLTYPGLNLRAKLPTTRKIPTADLAWRTMVNEVRAKQQLETRKMPVGRITNIMPVTELKRVHLPKTIRMELKTRPMPISALTNLMPSPRPAPSPVVVETPEYEPDPPALLGEYEPDLSLLFDSQRLLFPEHELGNFDPPDYIYEN